MPNLTVTVRELKYAGKTYLRGERFDATDKDAKLLKAIKKAADAPLPPKPVGKVASVRRPDPEPAPVVAAEPEPDLPPTSLGRYRTRRLKVED